jgi:eukaryotic-like serine/threonine-protein kinase
MKSENRPPVPRPGEPVDPTVPVELGRSGSTPPPAARVDPYLGKTIDGRYIVESILGEGGMGVVYRGRHKVIDKKVAIKILRGDLAKDPQITERFLMEARAASSIGNPHIVDISDFGQLADGCTYFVMEFLDGKSLTQALNEGRPFSASRLSHVGKQIAHGLAAAHAASIVHRDLKPDNVMLVTRGGEKDFVKVLDFGIAKVGNAAMRMTRAGTVFGTPHYMSPEQAAGTAVDHRTDIYSLGVIMYEMAAGKTPFDADNAMGVLTQHMYRAPVRLLELVPQVNVPPGLDAVIQKCLSKKPEQRYAAMEELVADLEKIDAGAVPGALSEMMARSGGFNVPADYFRNSRMPEVVPATPAGLPRKRWPLYAVIAAVASAALIVLAAVVMNAGKGVARPAVDPQPPVSAPVVASIPAPPVSAAPATKVTVLTADPAGATITRDGKDVGSPAVLELADGEKATLTVQKDGYKPETVTLAPGDKLTVTLKPVPSKNAGSRSTGGAVQPPKTGGGVTDDVGDPFKHK